MKIIVTCSLCNEILIVVEEIDDASVEKNVALYQQTVSCNEDGTAGIVITSEQEN